MLSIRALFFCSYLTSVSWYDSLFQCFSTTDNRLLEILNLCYKTHGSSACGDQSESGHNNLDFDLDNYAICRREQPESNNSSASNFLEDGKTTTDQCFFRGLNSQFNLEGLGRV
jgi:hypothetical protein